MKRLLTIINCLLLCISAYAENSDRTPFAVSQSDGSSLTLMLVGNEHFRYLSTMDGMPVMQIDGTYFLASFEDGRFTSTGILAHDEDMRTEAEETYIANNKEQLHLSLSQAWANKTENANLARARHYTRQNLGNSASETTKSKFKGKKRTPVILVNFSDLKFEIENPLIHFNDMLNKTGYNEKSHIGSAHDYFLDQSYNQFDITFDVIGPVTVNKSYKYYGKNNSYGVDTLVHYLIVDAIVEAMKEYPSIDFSPYDWDGNKTVDAVSIICAGPKETNNDEHIYSATYVQSFSVKGVAFDQYSFSSEIQRQLPSTGITTYETIGTFCHEFSHCLGLPDIYDTYYRYSNNNFDKLDIMGNGNGNGSNGSCPCGYSALERMLLGWLDFSELSEPCDIREMSDIGNTPIAYIIRNDGFADEFFVLENRKNEKWFKGLTANHGLVINHVIYNGYKWDNNTVNYNGFKHYTPICSVEGNEKGSSSYYFFPGKNDIKEFSDSSHPNTKLAYVNTDGSYYMHKPITDIKEENSLISFKFMGGSETNSISNVSTYDPDAAYFSINGTRIAGKPSTSGLYLVKTKNGVNKIHIK